MPLRSVPRHVRFGLILGALLLAAAYIVAIPLGWVDKDDRIGWEDLLFLVVVLFSLSELPGQLGKLAIGKEGLVAEFRQLTERVEGQTRAISDMQFLLSSIVTEHEYEKLVGLSTDAPFLVRYRDELDAELRRLRALGFVKNHDGTGVGPMRRERGDRDEEYDLKSYFRITDRGKDYLLRRAQVSSADDDEPD